MKKLILLSVLFISGCCNKSQIEVTKIWDNGYSAFPSIVKYGDNFYVSCREAKSHIFDDKGRADGKARILVSSDGKSWESVALLEKEGYDLRDPKLSVTPDGRLMVTMGGSVYENRELVRFIPQVSFSSDGRTFSNPEPVVFDDNITDEREWIWRVTWNGDTGYGVTYGTHFALVKTTDGVHYDFVKELDLDRSNAPGECTIRFAPDGRMMIMARCDNGDFKGRWGVSQPPYTDWTWSEVDIHFGGPDFILLDDGTVVAGTRYSFPSGTNKTMILRGDQGGRFEEFYLLPSGGDTSYPGFIEVDDQLWVVYYSCHGSELGTENKTMHEYDPESAKRHEAAIYLAKFPTDFFRKDSTK